jgi:hypothetical protein
MAGLGIAASPEPARGPTLWHLAWTVLGAVTIAVWPAFAARRAAPRPVILSVCGSAAVTAVFVALLGWLLAETRDGSLLGLAERLTSSIQTCWPFIIAVALHRTRRLSRPGGSGGTKDGATLQAKGRRARATRGCLGGLPHGHPCNWLEKARFKPGVAMHYCHNCGWYSRLEDGVYCAFCLTFFYSHGRMPRTGESL